MKGLLTGLFFFILGFTSIFSSVVFFAYCNSIRDLQLVHLHGAFTIIQVNSSVEYYIQRLLVKKYGGSSKHLIFKKNLSLYMEDSHPFT